MALEKACSVLSEKYLVTKIARIIYRPDAPSSSYVQNPNTITDDLDVEQLVLDSNHAFCLARIAHSDDSSIQLCKDLSKYFIIKFASQSCFDSINYNNKINDETVAIFYCCLEHAENEAKNYENPTEITQNFDLLAFRYADCKIIAVQNRRCIVQEDMSENHYNLGESVFSDSFLDQYIVDSGKNAPGFGDEKKFMLRKNRHRCNWVDINVMNTTHPSHNSSDAVLSTVSTNN